MERTWSSLCYGPSAVGLGKGTYTAVGTEDVSPFAVTSVFGAVGKVTIETMSDEEK